MLSVSYNLHTELQIKVEGSDCYITVENTLQGEENLISKELIKVKNTLEYDLEEPLSEFKNLLTTKEGYIEDFVRKIKKEEVNKDFQKNIKWFEELQDLDNQIKKQLNLLKDCEREEEQRIERKIEDLEEDKKSIANQIKRNGMFGDSSIKDILKTDYEEVINSLTDMEKEEKEKQFSPNEVRSIIERFIENNLSTVPEEIQDIDNDIFEHIISFKQKYLSKKEIVEDYRKRLKKIEETIEYEKEENKRLIENKLNRIHNKFIEDNEDLVSQFSGGLNSNIIRNDNGDLEISYNTKLTSNKSEWKYIHKSDEDKDTTFEDNKHYTEEDIDSMFIKIMKSSYGDFIQTQKLNVLEDKIKKIKEDKYYANRIKSDKTYKQRKQLFDLIIGQKKEENIKQQIEDIKQQRQKTQQQNKIEIEETKKEIQSIKEKTTQLFNSVFGKSKKGNKNDNNI